MYTMPEYLKVGKKLSICEFDHVIVDKKLEEIERKIKEVNILIFWFLTLCF